MDRCKMRSPAGSTFKPLLARRAGIQHLGQGDLEIVDMEIDVNRRPVSLISADIARALRRDSAGRLFDQADLGAAAIENDVGGDRPGSFGKAQGVTVKSQPFVDPGDIDRDGQMHERLGPRSASAIPRL
jgi:hypothetical protein